MPTTQRVSSRPTNVAARPEAPLARLHATTPTPTSTQRECRSASRPNTGAPDHVEDHERHREHADERELGLEPEMRPAPGLQGVEGRRRARAGRAAEETALDRRHHRREHLAVDVVEEIDQEEKHQRRPRALAGHANGARLTKSDDASMHSIVDATPMPGGRGGRWRRARKTIAIQLHRMSRRGIKVSSLVPAAGRRLPQRAECTRAPTSPTVRLRSWDGCGSRRTTSPGRG